MIIEINDHGRETYVMHRNPGALSIEFANQKAQRMTTPTTEPTVPTTQAAKRGPRTFEGECFSLVYNPETSHYDLAFEGKQYPIRFQAPAAFGALIKPLAAGMKHKSGRHEFTLEFEDDRLVEITNDAVDAAEGETVKRTASVTVAFNSPIKEWIRVILELPVEKALRTK
ncbi:hypothetical protein D3C87_829360 [compost metagenome]